MQMKQLKKDLSQDYKEVRQSQQAKPLRAFKTMISPHDPALLQEEMKSPLRKLQEEGIVHSLPLYEEDSSRYNIDDNTPLRKSVVGESSSSRSAQRREVASTKSPHSVPNNYDIKYKQNPLRGKNSNGHAINKDIDLT